MKETSGKGGPVTVLFLGYLWQVARALHESGAVELVAVGLEPQRARSAEAMAWCESAGVEHFDARRISDNARVREILDEGLDLCVVGAFGQILSTEFLQRPRKGVLNVHFSLLPKYRGGCPIEEQILAGETQGGVSLHWVVEDVDAGPLAAQSRFPIAGNDSYDKVFEQAHVAAGCALVDLLRDPLEAWPRTPQRRGTAPTPPRQRADGLIDWFCSARQIERLVRADGWKGWVRAERDEGVLIVREARVESVVSPAGDLSDADRQSYGTVIEAGAEPLIATGDGALRLLAFEGDAPQARERFPFRAGRPGRAPRVAMMQPTFLPYLGYFSLIADAELFVFLDDFQFCRRSWHQRNQLFLPGGKSGWVTLPVEHPKKEHRPGLHEMRPVLDAGFRRKFLETLRHAYRSTSYFEQVFPWVEAWAQRDWEDLASMNIALIRELAGSLGLETRFVRASEFDVGGERSARIAALLRAAGASSYLAAAGSAEYMLDDGVFPLPEIPVFFQRFEPTPYAQAQSATFVPFLSALDALMQVGPQAARGLLRRGTRTYASWQTLCGERA